MNSLYNKILFGVIFSSFFISCEDDSTEGVTRITYYPEIILEGDEQMAISVGTAYVEPGYEATENGVDITSSVEVKNQVNSSVPGAYTVSYSAKNVDGFSKTVIREVYVYEGALSTVDISGTYISNTILKTSTGGSSTAYSGGTVVINKITDGLFNVSCLIGGWYEVRYPGNTMAAPGVIAVQSDNSIANYGGTQLDWQDPVTDGGNSYYDPVSGHVHINSIYAGYLFVCDMAKK